VADRTGRVVVVGASAGGVEALRGLAAALPATLAAAVVVVLHIPAGAPSALATILDRAGPLPAVTATHGAVLGVGRILVAPADHHVLVAESRLRLSRGPRENGHRPAADPLFRSAAVGYGPRAVGVVLSGNRDDGSAGLAVLERHGGVAFVQDPAEATHPAMPTNALARVPRATALTVAELGRAIADAVRAAGPLPAESAGSRRMH
jgi:two-component system, chemotaxis family, protein-glutamate methylesterase/glutaminase